MFGCREVLPTGLKRPDDCSIARFNLPGIAASGLQKRDWLVVDGNIKNWLPVPTVAIGEDAGMPRAAPIGKPYLVAFFHSFVSCLSARIAPPGSQSRLGGGCYRPGSVLAAGRGGRVAAGRVAQAARMTSQ